ncbi:MAG: PAS domain-containing protein, partial [Alphaproteobacteria bacterium]|nr:PAS domain-containing protein [Alphaproteobacteria bacterium]
MKSRKPHHPSWVDRPWLSGAYWFVLGALALSTLSVFQKKMIGADPFAAQGFIVPILFGGTAAAAIGFFVRQARMQLVKRLESEIVEARNARDQAGDQEILVYILNLALTRDSLTEILQGALEKLLTRQGLKLHPKGSIFLFDRDNQHLEMVAQVGLNEVLLDKCARVALGQCLCGRAARDGQTVFANGLDHRHETTFDGIEPHGHYCVPIVGGGDLLGVLNLYLPEGHIRSDRDDTFTTAVSGALATAIRRVRTERELAHSEERFALAMQGANDGLWDWDLATDHVYYSPRWADMLGYEVGDLEPSLKTWERLVVPSDKDRVLAEVEDYLHGRTPFFDSEYRMLHKDGSEITILARGFKVEENGRPVRLVGTHTDVTSRKKLLKEKERAEAESRAKSVFLSTMSHELRTPLNAIIGFSDMIRNEVFGPLGEDRYLGYTVDINESGKHLLNLINQILDLSKIEAGEFTPDLEDFSLTNAINAALPMVRGRAEKNLVFLVTDIPEHVPMVVADEMMTKQILINLLTNAIKFTREGGTVSLGVKIENGSVLIEVADTGVGMTDEELATALEPFKQVQRGKGRMHEGTGLGLPLSKRLVELQGGVFTASSAPNRGTTIRFTLPMGNVVNGFAASTL